MLEPSDRNPIRIQLYRWADRECFATLPLMDIVCQSISPWLKQSSLLTQKIKLLLLDTPEETFPMEEPIVVNLVPEFGYAYVIVYEGSIPIYRHPHSLYDIVTRTLQTILQEKYPNEAWWGFRIDTPGLPLPSWQPRLHQLKSSQSEPTFSIRRLAEEAPPTATLEDFGLAINSQIRDKSEADATLQILLSQSLYDNLCKNYKLSHEVEEGGFLVGNVYCNGDQEAAYLLEIKRALSAKHTGASFLHLTFTGDSFVEVKRVLRQEYEGERLLGWYHTHLFPATTVSFGLSSIDVELHMSTFSLPWQIAGLINLDLENGDRTLRFYGRQGNNLELFPHRIIDERN